MAYLSIWSTHCMLYSSREHIHGDAQVKEEPGLDQCPQVVKGASVQSNLLLVTKMGKHSNTVEAVQVLLYLQQAVSADKAVCVSVFSVSQIDTNIRGKYNCLSPKLQQGRIADNIIHESGRVLRVEGT